MVSKAQRRENIGRAAANLDLIRAAKCKVEILDRSSHHYRIIGPTGVRLNFYASTLAWTGPNNRRAGHGIESMLSFISKANPQKAKPPEERRPKGKISVTIFSDAAFSSRDKIGGWGAWMKSGDRPAIYAGSAMAGPVATSFQAEAQALANAMSIAKSRGLLVAGEAVMVQTDCLPVLQHIRGFCTDVLDSPAGEGKPAQPIRTNLGAKGRGKPRRQDPAIALICDLIRDTGITLVTRHVPGHRLGDGRAWVNRWCDAEAKKHLKAKRESFHAA